MSFRMRSLPDCRGMCKCGMRRSSFFMSRMSFSLAPVTSRELTLSLGRSVSARILSQRSARSIPRSCQAAKCMPESTHSFMPLAQAFSIWALTSS